MKPPDITTEARADTKQDHIMDVALDLFSRRGFDAVSVRDLATEAGVNLAMINYYFKSKDGLLMAIVERKATVLTSLFQSFLNDPGIPCMNQLKRVVDMYVEVFLVRRSLHRVLMREIMHDHRPEVMNFINQLWLRNSRFIVDIVKQGIKKKEFRKVDPELMVATLVGPINQISLASCVVNQLVCNDPDCDVLADPAFRKRVTKHMHQLLESLLLPHSS